MTKRDWVWVAMRVLGLYLIVEAVPYIPLLVMDAVILWNAQGEGDGLAATRENYVATAATHAASLVTCLAAGSYFLCRGRGILDLACRAPE